MMALAEFPGAPAVLDDARARLEATGRPIESLALADRGAGSHDRSRAPAGAAARRRDAVRAAGRQRRIPATPPTPGWRCWGSIRADREAAAAAERLLRAVGDWERCADLLAWQVARAAARSAGRRQRQGDRSDGAALAPRGAAARAPGRGRRGAAPLRPARHARRAAARRSPIRPSWRRWCVAISSWRSRPRAPAWRPRRPSGRARWSDRAALLGARGRGNDAERDALAALDLDPRNTDAIAALERMYEGERRARQLAEELGRRAARLPPRDAAPLHFGRGRAWERAGDRAAAREAYRRAMSLDPTLAEPVAALGALAAREGDWSEVAKLLESEVGLATSPTRKGPLLIELAVVQGDRLGDPARAVQSAGDGGAVPARRSALAGSRARAFSSPPETGRRPPTRSIGWRRAAPPSPTRPSASSPSPPPPRRPGSTIAR